jgi:hypothetical protein
METENTFTVPSVSVNGQGRIDFKFAGDTVRASLFGAELYAESARPDGSIDMRITDAEGEILADLVLKPRSHRTATENVIDIGSALLWSHQRWFEATAMERGVPSRYFEVDDGGCRYIIVSYNLDHAKQILLDHGVEFTKDDGTSAPVDDPAFAAIEWKEVSAENADKRMVHFEDAPTAKDGKCKLSECAPGDWFSTEW